MEIVKLVADRVTSSTVAGRANTRNTFGVQIAVVAARIGDLTRTKDLSGNAKREPNRFPLFF